MRPSVYLAGPITGATYDGATNWREWAREELAKDGIDGFSPMRGKQYLLRETTIKDHYDENVLSTMRAIMTRDFRDSTQCDVILVNFLGAERVSIGTVMEIAWGFAFRKPVILVMDDEDKIHEHGMLREAAGYRVKTITEGLAICKSVLLP